MKNFFAKAIERRPSIDLALSSLDRNRLKLPQLSLREYFSSFEDEIVEFYEVPIGPWSSPVEDVLMLSKIAKCAKPKRILEVGSYRGYTSLALARATNNESMIVTLDQHPNHGEAYQNTPFEKNIQRIVGQLKGDILDSFEKESFDFIFLDAGHRYEEVKFDSEFLLPYLNPNGYFTWHDYDNWGRFNRFNGVPEYLHEVAETKTVAHVGGSNLGIYSPKWDSHPTFASDLLKTPSKAPDPWASSDER